MKRLLPKLFLLLFVLFFLSVDSFAQYDLVVAQDGSGNYTTVQAAINAAPAGRTTPYVIYIKNGIYKEKINIPATKPFLKLVGENVAHVVLTYDDYAAKLTSCTNTVGTQNSASFSVNANDFSAVNITFENNYGDGSQAVAVLVNADRAIFLNCRFMANQDTVYLKGSGAPRNYFKNCYIDGNVDFIFGSAIALFDSCVIYAKSRSSAGVSYITAPNTPNGQAYGYVFRNARLPMNTGSTLYYLSRPWPSPDVASTRQKAVFLSSRLSSHIKPEGWSVWDANTNTANLYYGEYDSKYFNGQPADVSQRVAWSYQLSATDAATYNNANILGTWDPCATVPEICYAQSASLAISNFKGVKGASSSQFTWNATWPVSNMTYTLYRSADRVNFSPVYVVTSPTDTAVNFNYTDAALPSTGNAWYYYVEANAAGYTNEISDTVVISNLASMTVNASAALNYCGFSQLLGAPSASQTFTISGANLTGNVTITPPTNYEISTDNNNWYTSSNPLVIPSGTGSIATTTVYIHLNATAVGNYSGTVMVTTSAVADYSFLVSGVTFAASTSFPLQEWPLTINNSDSAFVRSPAVVASTSTLNRLYTSDGTTPTAGPIPSYSGQYGQALGAIAAGNNWSAVGGTLNRNYYEQFTVTAVTGSQVRVDSITFMSDFFNTISGIKMGVAYSKNGFSSPADSSEFYSGVGPGGVSLTLATSGTFAKSFTLQRNDAGPVNRYSLSLNGINGITLNSGETITIRLYWACGSTGTPRFAFLKDVVVKGVVLTPVPMHLVRFDAQAASKSNHLTWTTTNEQQQSKIEIQKSSDGVRFAVIAVQEAKNQNSNLYEFDDLNFSTQQFYRLQFIAADGSSTYSHVVQVKRITEKLMAQPNPATGYTDLWHPQATAASSVSLFNNEGKLMQKVIPAPGSSKTRIQLFGIPSGIYFIQYANGLLKQVLKIVKE